MNTLFELEDRDTIRVWAGRRGRRRVDDLSDTAAEGIRFAFYGRTSTREFQDPVTSRAWQREMART
jgi:site-specific DNA recombinase